MSLGGYNMSTKKKIEKELEKENIIKEIKKAQTDVAVAEKFFQFVSDQELVDVFRGDCYTNTVTMRLNRNFIDSEVPVNEIIMDNTT